MAATKTVKKTAKRPAKRASKRVAKTVAKRAAPRRAKQFAVPTMRATGRARGRPPKIDQPSLCDPSKTVGVAIADLVAEGLPPDVAAPLAGVHPKTLDVWLTRGTTEIVRLVSSEIVDEPILETETPYVALVEEVTMADASSRGAALMTLKRLGERNHPAMLAYMAARWSHLYGQKATRLEVSGPGGGPVRAAVSIPSLDQAEMMVAQLEAAHASQLAAIDVQSREVAS